ncbi:MAG: cyclic nucleotide-binding domain-containing protein, partial [Deltaproteobacteria bacterium]|nr:cyclic nucleotide-binding domain-containing protein [Deltaproteobacteria bacterium]
MELGKKRGALRFDEVDAALEWVEDEILAAERHSRLPVQHPLELGEIDLLAGLDAQAIAAVAGAVATRHYEEGEQIFAAGDPADELLLVRRGRVRVFLPLALGDQLHLATFAQGDSLGEIAFLERSTRTARAVALEPTELFALSRRRFDEVSRGDPAAGAQIFARLARVLAARLRRTDAEVRALQDA